VRKLIDEDYNSNNVNVNNHVVIENDGQPTLMDILEEEEKENPNLFNPIYSNILSNIHNYEIMEKKKIIIKTPRMKKYLIKTV
jgi:hypothetical protein